MSANSSNATAQIAPTAAPTLQTRPRLSIVLLSAGDPDHLDRALEAVLEASFFLETELVVVRACRSDDEKVRLQRLSRYFGFSLEIASPLSSREELAERGAAKASGDIVTLRDDYAASGEQWLSQYVLPAESVVWDSPVARPTAELADADVRKSSTARTPIVDRAVTPRPLGAPTWRPDSATELAP